MLMSAEVRAGLAGLAGAPGSDVPAAEASSEAEAIADELALEWEN
jgi:hypothetical protein